jgi:succinate dehydrogenase/fumarate reductase flavoprotein subunit
MRADLGSLPDAAPFDVVVIGAGAAGLGAALNAAIAGARVLIVERTAYVGGTTALSGGTTWVPGTRHAAPDDSIGKAARYLDRTVGERAPRALRDALLANGAQAIAHYEANSDVQFRPYPRHPDYLSAIEGSTVAGRALEPLPFDGRRLGALFGLLRPPIPEFTVLGGMMVDRTDIGHLLHMTRSLKSLRHGMKILLRHASDRLRHPRGTRLVMGNALVARLVHSLARHPGVSLLVDTEVVALARNADGRVDAVTLERGGVRRTVAARRAVVLASGGFNRHPQRRAELLPGADAAWCPGAPGHTGAAHDLALALGAGYGRGALSNAFWAPVSLRRRADGSQAAFPHFLMDRAKPGMITIDRGGRRFVDESTSYHLFGLAMQPQAPGAGRVPAFLVCDADALRRYGLGMVRPGGKGLEPFLADGYLTRADTLAELAQKLGIDAAGLAESVARMNASAESGVDADFGRGVGAYAINIGDTSWPGPNPNLGPLRRAPYYAVRLYPGDIGAATGLRTDAHARVLDAADQPIAGLYACGNDMQSAMGGVYAGPGITIGPALVFAYLAMRDALADRATPAARPKQLHTETA